MSTQTDDDDPQIVLKNMADDDAAMVEDAIDEAGIRPEIVKRE